ncbi:MAG: cryptochrome/photolyase family protein, partial [Candidatus Margulisiibacteriota bacterium]|nr:cryptochrome/photolyase family protein [Candidatus Margulisiibacteriota bacterium]
KIKQYKIKNVVFTEPSEYRVLQLVSTLNHDTNITLDIRQDMRFFCKKSEFIQWADGQKQLRMEFFYRYLRKEKNVLMQDRKPVGGKWNYDHENRSKPNLNLSVPRPLMFSQSSITKDVVQLVETYFKDHFGESTMFHYAVTRKDALKVLAYFIETNLIHYGKYQDAMIENEPWMYHAHISLYLNSGLLLPDECVNAAQDAYKKGAPLNAVEGFIRQILGWREFIRGIYWLKMPAYKDENYLQAKRPLPDFYWTANTAMNCIKQCVNQTINHAYAHHIQRLMVLGNFCLIAGIDPKEVNEWFYIVYLDAYEWVELPNVTGMSLFADGGVFASKPYASGGGYINKMSNYCKTCKFDVNKKTGKEACPFNYLYWNFLIKNSSYLGGNPRMGMMYSLIRKMDSETQKDIQDSATKFLSLMT